MLSWSRLNAGTAALALALTPVTLLTAGPPDQRFLIAADWSVTAQQESGLGNKVVIADFNCDGRPDVAVAAVSYSNGETREGAAFVWYAPPGGLRGAALEADADWMVESNLENATTFGDSLGSPGDINGDGCAELIVGDPFHSNGESSEGKLWLWYGAPGGLNPSGTLAGADWRAESNQEGAHFSHFDQDFAAGDVNGDGYGDLIVGAHNYDTGPGSNEGAVFVWSGGPSGLGADGTPANADWMAEGDEHGYLGWSAASAGDVNGDGFSDIVVGASDYGTDVEGVAFVWYGGPGGLGPSGTAANADWVAEGDGFVALLGRSVSPAGDLNGDGYDDIAVGAAGFELTPAVFGTVFAWYGGPGGLGPAGSPTNADWSATSDREKSFFGYDLAAGDLNGDGYTDLVVGATHFDGAFESEGAVFVWCGGPDGLGPSGRPSNTAWSELGGARLAQFGGSVAAGGDVDGDGADELLIGALGMTNTPGKGAAYLVSVPLNCPLAACEVSDIAPIQSLRAVKSASRLDVNLTYAADRAATAYNTWYVLLKQQIPDAREGGSGNRPAGCAPASGTTCSHVDAVPPPRLGPLLYYQVRGVCNQFEATE